MGCPNLKGNPIVKIPNDIELVLIGINFNGKQLAM